MDIARGFVKPFESRDEAVKRELGDESGVDVHYKIKPPKRSWYPVSGCLETLQLCNNVAFVR